MPEDAIWVQEIGVCPQCHAIVKVYMDDDGQRWCGLGKHKWIKEKYEEHHTDLRY